MNKIMMVCFAIISLAACNSDTTTADSSQTDGKSKVGTATTENHNPWFVHRISSLSEKSNFGRTDCYIKGEFENNGDAPLYIAQVKYKTVLVENPPEGSKDNQSVTVEVAPEYGKPNLNPFLPGETRSVELGPMYQPCKAFKELKLVAFVARGINSDGTMKARVVRDGLPALIIENNTVIKITRE